MRTCSLVRQSSPRKSLFNLQRKGILQVEENEERNMFPASSDLRLVMSGPQNIHTTSKSKEAQTLVHMHNVLHLKIMITHLGLISAISKIKIQVVTCMLLDKILVCVPSSISHVSSCHVHICTLVKEIWAREKI